MWSLVAGARGRDHLPMQIIAGSNPITRGDRSAVARSAFSGLLLVAVGLLLGWLCLGTSFVQTLVPHGRPTMAETATGVVAWGFAIVVPAAFLIIGVARIAAIVDTAALDAPAHGVRQPRQGARLGLRRASPASCIPGGRRLHELVLGPFGILVFAVVPPPSITRHVGGRWEIRDDRGRWIPIEAPIDRATRDAERVRGWLASDDRDFVVRVYAAIITDDPTMDRSPACAVVPPDGARRLDPGAARAARPDRGARALAETIGTSPRSR